MNTIDINATPTKTYAKAYTAFRGVDFSTDNTQVDTSRSPSSVNMCSDSAGFPEKRLGWRYLQKGDNEHPINNMFYAVFGDGTHGLYIHKGTDIVKVDWSDESSLTENSFETIATNKLADNESVAFSFDGKVYILDGRKYSVLEHEESGYTVKDVSEDAYIPTVRISITGDTVTQIGSTTQYFGGHTYEEYESPNILTYKRKVTMVGDGVSKKFYVGEDDIDSIDVIKVNDAEVTAFTFDKYDSLLKFNNAPAAHPDGTGLANIEVTYTCRPKKRDETSTNGDGTKKVFDTGEDCEDICRVEVNGTKKTYETDYTFDQTTKQVTFSTAPANGKEVRIVWYKRDYDKEIDRVNECTITETFGYFNDNRFFFSGIPDYKYQNIDFMSGSGDPTYIPYDGYVRVGADTAKIVGYLKQYDSMLVIKEDNEQDAQVFARSAQPDDNGTFLFPIKQGIKGVGAIAKRSFGNLRDNPMFLAKEGVFAVASADVMEQRSVQDMSFFVNKKLCREQNLETACACTWNGYYILVLNNHAYVADSRQRTGSSDTESYGYEWYYWENIPATRMWNIDNVLYFTNGSDIMRFNSDYDKMYKYSDGSYPMIPYSEMSAAEQAEYDAQEDDEHRISWRHKVFSGEAIHSLWSTKADTFDTIVNLKTIPKKGCGIIIKPYTRSSIDIGYMTNREGEKFIKHAEADILDFTDIDFERITFNAVDVPQVVALNQKIKKFNLIQFIIKSDAINEGFGLYGIQLSYTIGRYIK